MKKKHTLTVFLIGVISYFYFSKQTILPQEKIYLPKRELSSKNNQKKILSKIKPIPLVKSKVVQKNRQTSIKNAFKNSLKTKTKFDLSIENTPYLLNSTEIKKIKNNFQIKNLKPIQMPLIKNKISKRIGRLSGIISFTFLPSEQNEINRIVEDFELSSLKKVHLNEKQLWMLRFQEIDALAEIFKRVENTEIKADLDIIQRKR